MSAVKKRGKNLQDRMMLSVEAIAAVSKNQLTWTVTVAWQLGKALISVPNERSHALTRARGSRSNKP